MRFLRQLSLQYRIAGGVLLGLVLLFSLFGFLAVRTINESKDVALEERLRLAETTAQSVDALLKHTTRQLEAAADLLALGPGQSQREQMEAVYHVVGTFEKVVRLDADGEELWAVPSAPEPEGWALVDEPQLRQALQRDETSVLQLTPSGDTHPPVAVIVAPMHDSEGALDGFLAGELHLSHAGIDLVPLPEHERTVRAEIVDTRGYIIAHSGEEIYEPDEHAAVLADFIARGESGTTVHRVEGGPDHVVAYHPLEGFPGGVVVEQIEDEALAVPRNLQRTMLIYGLGALVVASGAAWFHAHTVVRPIRQLTGDAARMTSGDLESPIAVTRQDEIGALADSFDEMRIKLKASLEESAGWARELEGRVRERTREVEERNRELEALNRVRRQLLAKTISAQEEERKRLARELHDESAQTLTALLMTLKTAEDALASSPQQAGKALAKGRSQTEIALREIRKAIMDLRPTALDDLGLASAARWYADETLRPLGVKVSLEVSGDEARATGPAATAIFRIVQEAVSNIAKHAQAKNARVGLEFRQSEVLVLVEDDGQGFDPNSLKLPHDSGRGLGLLGMRERAELFGGNVEIESSPGQGTRIRVRVPVE
jgi:signal transduction histidine kinase